jgi:tRNA-splicing ligase RtcB
MPDAHVGYGLPIGGVLATADSVIPYAVGMDIACRMHLTVLRDPCERLTDEPTRFETALRKGTRFGVGSTWTPRQEHPVMDMDWGVSPVTRAGRDLAWSQLGTSGSGNHFAEFGLLTITESAPELPAAGQYLALLTHSGSRGVGAQVATHYSRVAEGMHPELRPELRRLAWLGLDTHAGQEYWKAMELMGVYAAANHEIIHREVLRLLGSSALYTLENHHNFAWREQWDGRELIVHRKGATPAAAGVLGVIPGSMASPGYVVRGRGNPESLNSASHGAGRCMSRKQALRSLSWDRVQRVLRERGVRLLAGGLDEAPMAYKDIDKVMEAQRDLVTPLARFEPRLVLMAP